MSTIRRPTHLICCEKLWEAVADGTIDMVVSDHSPCTPKLKKQETGDFMEAWGGISALQFGLPVMWTSFRDRGFDLNDLTRLMCEGPARLAGLENRKGTLVSGFDADIVVWDPDAAFTVEPELVYHRHKLTPYAGLVLYGRVEAVYLRGELAYENGKLLSEPKGELIN